MDPLLEERLSRCRTLPTLPAIAVEVVRLAREEQTQLGKLSAVIASDLALAAKILSVANSAAFAGRGGKSTTVSHAVMRLGGGTVVTLALSFALVKLRGTHPTFDYDLFWKRSLFAATVARCLATNVRHDPEELFLGGLFQNVGMLALHEAFPDDYAKCVFEAGYDHLRLERFERERFDTDHREVGVWLARNWQLPSYLHVTTRASHNPLAEPHAHYDGAARAVALSGFVAEIWLNAVPRAEALKQAGECARNWLGMGGEQFTQLVGQVAKALPEFTRLFDSGVDERTMTGILDEAKDTLVQVSLKAARDSENTVANLAREKALAEQKASKDALTGLFNRGFFDDNVESAFEAARGYGRPLSIVFCDLDHFKSINDKYGHPAGDQVLQSIGRLIMRCVRQLDIPARYGGEEFVVILPATDRAGAQITSERMRKLVEKLGVTINDGRSLSVTASFGFATMDENYQPTSAKELVEQADKSLYEAKRGGRNKVVG